MFLIVTPIWIHVPALRPSPGHSGGRSRLHAVQLGAGVTPLELGCAAGLLPKMRIIMEPASDRIKRWEVTRSRAWLLEGVQ